MPFYQYLHIHLGYLTWPLLVCSLLALGLLLEKIVTLTLESLRKPIADDSAQINHRVLQPSFVVQGLSVLCLHRHEPKLMREEIAAIWLRSRRVKLSSGIKVLQVIALLTPLLGLLGTVLGLINVFDSLADHHGPIEPALLADGLGMAMYTTAAGLAVALPALAGAHGFQIWIDNLVHKAEHGMNYMNLKIDGVDLGKEYDR